VAERRPEAVFPFVTRLVEAGADLAEFVNGLGDVLRALMVRVLGGEPEETTHALRTAVEAVAGQFAPGDVLRMLHLLQEAEGGLRRSANARLHLESLLLRYALLDRTVDLREVLDALGGAAPGAPASTPAPAPAREGRASRPPVMRDVPAAPPRAPTRARRPGPDAPEPTGTAAPPPDADTLQARWPEVVEAVRGRRPLVAAALEHATPAAVDGAEVRLLVSDSDVHTEGLERSRGEVEAGLRAVFGADLRVRYLPAQHGSSGAAGVEPPPPPQRLDQRTDRGERLKAYRAKDQALDAMADALDLELLD
jgi:DNA polymerase-3 subunit gamma/tau